MRISVLVFALACAVRINAGTVSPSGDCTILAADVNAGYVNPLTMVSSGSLSIAVPELLSGCSVSWVAEALNIHVPAGTYSFDLLMNISDYTVTEDPAPTVASHGGVGFDRQLEITDVLDQYNSFQNNEGIGCGTAWCNSGSWVNDFNGALLWAPGPIPEGDYNFRQFVQFALSRGPDTNSIRADFTFVETDTLNFGALNPEVLNSPEPAPALMLACGAALILAFRFRAR